MHYPWKEFLKTPSVRKNVRPWRYKPQKGDEKGKPLS